MEQSNTESVFGPFREMWISVLGYLPSLLAGFLIVLLGLGVAWLVKKTVARVVLLMRLDRPFRNVRWARALAHADVRYTLANAVGNVFAAVVFLVFLDNAMLVWRLSVLAEMIGALVLYLPRLVVTALVILVGSALAAFAAGRVRTGLAAEGFTRAAFAGKCTHWGLMTVVTAFALEELGIGPRTLDTALKVGLGALGLALALSLGLGSRNAVAQMWESKLQKPPSAE